METIYEKWIAEQETAEDFGVNLEEEEPVSAVLPLQMQDSKGTEEEDADFYTLESSPEKVEKKQNKPKKRNTETHVEMHIGKIQVMVGITLPHAGVEKENCGQWDSEKRKG